MGKRNLYNLDKSFLYKRVEERGWNVLKPARSSSGQSDGCIVEKDNQQGFLRFLTFKGTWFENDSVKEEAKSLYSRDVIRYQREVSEIIKLQSENIFSILECGEYPEKHLYWYISSLGTPFNLYWDDNFLTASVDEKFNEAIKVCREILNGLKEAHANDIIHRDIKPKNIIFREGCYEIIDWGIAKFLDLDSITDGENPMNVGFSPQFLQFSSATKNTKWVDVFMVAQILIWMLKSPEIERDQHNPINWQWVPFDDRLSQKQAIKIKAFLAICSESFSCPSNGEEALVKFDKIFSMEEKEESKSDFSELKKYLKDVAPEIEEKKAFDLKRYNQYSFLVEEYCNVWNDEIGPYIEKLKSVLMYAETNLNIVFSKSDFQKYNHEMISFLNDENSTSTPPVVDFNIEMVNSHRKASFSMNFAFITNQQIDQIKDFENSGRVLNPAQQIILKNNISQLFGRMHFSFATNNVDFGVSRDSSKRIYINGDFLEFEKSVLEISPNDLPNTIKNILFSEKNILKLVR